MYVCKLGGWPSVMEIEVAIPSFDGAVWGQSNSNRMHTNTFTSTLLSSSAHASSQSLGVWTHVLAEQTSHNRQCRLAVGKAHGATRQFPQSNTWPVHSVTTGKGLE